MAPQPNALLDAALDYAHRGWPVFPCHWPTQRGCSCGKHDCDRIAKHPRYHAQDLPHGLHSASTDETQIRRWWHRWPHANVAIRTGDGLVVIDLDPRHHSDVSQELLEANGCAFPQTVEDLTGAGGRHLWYQHAGGAVPNSVGSEGQGLAPGIDVRGAGGYVIAPPSLHASGRRYEWEVSSHPDDLPLALLPPWVVTRLAERQASPNGHPPGGDKIPMGQRNATLASYAGTMRRVGMMPESILAALLVENTRCELPLSEGEVRKIATSVGRYAPATGSQTSTVTRPERGQRHGLRTIPAEEVSTWRR
jgi:hypothetical protein